MDQTIIHNSTPSRKVDRYKTLHDKIRRRLPRQDRQLLAFWEAGQVSQHSLARAIGCHPANLYRRLRRLRARLYSPAAAALAQNGRRLPVLQYTIALRYHLLGQKRSAIARDLVLSRHRVYRILAEFSGWLSQQQIHQGDRS